MNFFLLNNKSGISTLLPVSQKKLVNLIFFKSLIRYKKILNITNNQINEI